MNRYLKQDPIPYGMHDSVELDGDLVGDLLEQPNHQAKLEALSKDIALAADKVNAVTCFHCHTWTCRPKGNGTPSCERCRLDMGRPPSSTTRLVQSEWSDTLDPEIKATRLTRVKIVRRWQLVLNVPVATGVVHPVGTAVVQGKETKVHGVLAEAIDGAGTLVVVVETTDALGFVVGVDLVVGGGGVRTVVVGTTIVAVSNISKWRARLKRRCCGCKALLEGGMFSAEEYTKAFRVRLCRRCRGDASRCVQCKHASACGDLSVDHVRLMHATCLVCDPVWGYDEDVGAGGNVGVDGREEGGTGLDGAVKMAAQRYQKAAARVVAGSGVGTSGLEEPRELIDAMYFRALETLRCRNVFGYHGTVLDRLIEMKEPAMWAPMVEAAGANLYHVVVTSDAIKDTCEHYLKQYGLDDRVHYLSARTLEEEHEQARLRGANEAVGGRSVEMGDGDGCGYRILANHVPRQTHSIRFAIDHLFGDAILCLDEESVRKTVADEFGRDQSNTIRMVSRGKTNPSHGDGGVSASELGSSEDEACDDVVSPSDGAPSCAVGSRITVWRENDALPGVSARCHATVVPTVEKFVSFKFADESGVQSLSEMEYNLLFVKGEWMDLFESNVDVEAQSDAIEYMVAGKTISHKGRAVSDWYSWVLARVNLQRVLADSVEHLMFMYHELNPPNDVVDIDSPPVAIEASDDCRGSVRARFLEVPYDERTIALHQRRSTRRSRYQSQTSAVCSAVLKCNTEMAIMPTAVDAKAACYYLAKYFRKNSCKQKDLLVLYHKAKQLQKRYPSRAKDAVSDPERRRAKNFVQKILNRANGDCEYTSTQVAQMLLGHESQYCSHGTFVWWWVWVRCARWCLLCCRMDS